MIRFIRNKALFFVVGLISLLLLLNMYLIKINGDIIEENIERQVQAEQIKVIGNDIITTLHALDLGIRGFALVTEPYIEEAINFARERHPIILDSLENMLKQQALIEMSRFEDLKLYLNAYYDTAAVLQEEIRMGNIENFMNWLRADPGYDLFVAIEKLNLEIFARQDEEIVKSNEAYQKALRNAFLLQVFLFLVTFPTLLITAIFTRKAFKIQTRYRQLEEEKNQILLNQNQELEKLVNERTYEIQRQSEEIQAQNEEIIAQNESISLSNDELIAKQEELIEQRDLVQRINEELRASQEIIEYQTAKIENQNKELQQKVDAQTEYLKKTNEELLEQNQRLEQFAYIISHNLRSPIARILGLAQVIDMAKDKAEETTFISKIKETSRDIDVVIKDLMTIIEVRRGRSEPKVPILLAQVFDRTVSLLRTEIEQTSSILETEFQIERIVSIPSYLESVFFNLISNAIKYRKHDEPARLTVKSRIENGWIKISFEDQGLGMSDDVVSNKLFTPFKRFHSHVEGKGLGLYLVKSQALLLGGNLEVRSELGKGSIFILSLPIEESQKNPEPTSANSGSDNVS